MFDEDEYCGDPACGCAPDPVPGPASGPYVPQMAGKVSGTTVTVPETVTIELTLDAAVEILAYTRCESGVDFRLESGPPSAVYELEDLLDGLITEAIRADGYAVNTSSAVFARLGATESEIGEVVPVTYLGDSIVPA